MAFELFLLSTRLLDLQILCLRDVLKPIFPVGNESSSVQYAISTAFHTAALLFNQPRCSLGQGVEQIGKNNVA